MREPLHRFFHTKKQEVQTPACWDGVGLAWKAGIVVFGSASTRLQRIEKKK
jgi:hypothetical protein